MKEDTAIQYLIHYNNFVKLIWFDVDLNANCIPVVRKILIGDSCKLFPFYHFFIFKQQFLQYILNMISDMG